MRKWGVAGLGAAIVASLIALVTPSSPVGAAGPPTAAISIVTGSSPLDIKFIAQTSGIQTTSAAYKWDFGDGSSITIPSPSTKHHYKNPGHYSVHLIVSATNGATASTTATLLIVDCVAGSGQCSADLKPGTSIVDLNVAGPIGSFPSPGLDLLAGGWRFSACQPGIHPAASIADFGFSGTISVNLTYITSNPSQAPTTCFASSVPFTDAQGVKVTSGPLPSCQSGMPPCVQSIGTNGSQVMKQILIPPNDPKVGAP